MKTVKRLLFIAIICLFCGKINAAEPSATDVLNKLDSAKTAPELITAIDAVKRLGPGATPILEAYAFDVSKEPRIRMVVLRKVIAARTSDQASRTLQELIRNTSDTHFKALCAEELGRKFSPEGKALLKNLLVNPKEDAHVQIAAALGLAEMGDDSGKDRAMKAVLQNEPWANTAIRALEKLKAKDVVAHIDKKARTAPDSYERDKARIASLRIQLVDKSNDEQLALLEGALRDKESREVRKWAAMRLAEIGTPEAGQVLAAVAKSEDRVLADMAMRGLRMGVERKAWTDETATAWVGKRERKDHH